MAPTKADLEALHCIKKKPNETFATYVGRWRAVAVKISPPIPEADQMDILFKTTAAPRVITLGNFYKPSSLKLRGNRLEYSLN